MKKQNWEILIFNKTVDPILLSEKDGERIISSLFGCNRTSVISKNVKIPKKKSNDFWKLYQEFQAKRIKFSLPVPAVPQQSELSDSDVVDQNPYLAKSLGKLNRRYYKLFRKVVGQNAAIRVLQVEMQINASAEAVHVFSHLNNTPNS
jgi:hypothetical protein